MRKIIDKKVYDTETAKYIANFHNGLSESDFGYVLEKLYVTIKGQYFLHATGGARTIYNESLGNSSCGTETIILLSKEELYNWLEKNEYSELIEEIFKGGIQEG